ncbi:MAG: NrfD/PsrC family molybdoenzyme membrane anchor subunit [Sandaracinus sp.]
MSEPRQPGFVSAALREIAGEGWAYRAWVLALATGCLIGTLGYRQQMIDGLYATTMTDQISWGAYIANFTFLVGVASALLMVVLPGYGFRLASFKRIVFVGEAVALSAVMMCLLFVVVDIGRPEQSWHLMPWLGSLNFPASILSWDVVVLSGYLGINVVLVGLAMSARYRQQKRPPSYVPMLFVSMVWAISIHTVTAFLYTWLGARPFWNSAIVAARFMVSAAVCEPAILVIALRSLQRGLGVPVDEEVFFVLRRVMTTTLLVDLFLFGAEVFTELWSGSRHAESMRYLLFGLEGHDAVRAWVWASIAIMATTAGVLLSPLKRRPYVLELACVAGIVGVWIEKGMALVVPGFVPSPLGEITEYQPSRVELMVCLGIWCFGALAFTLMARVMARIEDGSLRAAGTPPLVPTSSMLPRAPVGVPVGVDPQGEKP